jgi:hypothetical protein
VYEVEFDHNASWLLDTLDLSLVSNGVDFAYGPMKSLQICSWPVDVTRSSLTVLSLGHGDSVALSMNATSLVLYMGMLYSTNSSSIFPIPISILPMFELPSVHYRGDNLTTFEDTSISLGDFFIIDSSADGGYVYNTAIIADFGILRSVLASAFPAFTTMEDREFENSKICLCNLWSLLLVRIITEMLLLISQLVCTPKLYLMTLTPARSLCMFVQWTRIPG